MVRLLDFFFRRKILARTVFFISDGTGITAEGLGRSLLSQFESFSFDYVTIPYVNSKDKAQQALGRIEQVYMKDGERPLIFTTLVNTEISQLLHRSHGLVIEFFQTFINPLENELGKQSSHMVGRSHGVKNYSEYMARINAVNYALAHDDGLNAGKYNTADVILIGVSRCGKTPTCIYLALQFGIFAANYPLTPDEMNNTHLPQMLVHHKTKLFGLTIDSMRLHKIRHERLPNKSYASLNRCESEVSYVESLFKRENIDSIDTTSRSIEEIAAEIMTIANIKRRM